MASAASCQDLEHEGNVAQLLVVPVKRDKAWWECSIDIAWPLVVIEERV